jgi:hypothetical protein
MNRKSMVRCALIVTPLFAWGCALPQGGRLPKADLPVVHHAAEMKPSLSFKISFVPPGSDKEPKLVEEFVQEFETANLFMRIELHLVFHRPPPFLYGSIYTRGSTVKQGREYRYL